MGNVPVICDTRSGNTRKMAEHVAAGAEAVEGTTVRLKHISEADGQDLVWCDGAAVGSPTQMGQPSWQIKKWFDESGVWGQCDGRVGVAVCNGRAWRTYDCLRGPLGERAWHGR